MGDLTLAAAVVTGGAAIIVALIKFVPARGTTQGMVATELCNERHKTVEAELDAIKVWQQNLTNQQTALTESISSLREAISALRASIDAKVK